MTRRIATPTSVSHGRTTMGGEPLVFHCNFYNYWLQKTLLLDPALEMPSVIRDAAESAAHAALVASAAVVGATDLASRRKLASDAFSELGFGIVDLSGVGPTGGTATFPVSHYGACLRQAAGAEFAEPQSHFDAGYAAAAAALLHGLPAGSFTAEIEACQAMGAPQGRVQLRRTDHAVARGVGVGAHWEGTVVPHSPHTSVNEAEVLAALAGLDFSGNEEGLIPRFGVMLTNHFANFYNRISFEFVRRMADSGLLEPGEDLLRDAGHRCAFHTFGGIMVSAEWDAVVRPQCKTREDWVHGIVACVNSLGWGLWRVHELSPERLVIRIWDDYESTGWIGMYGASKRPVSHLAAGGAAGIMNLVYVGAVEHKPTLDLDFYVRTFESDAAFSATHAKSMACGDEFTEIVVVRG